MRSYVAENYKVVISYAIVVHTRLKLTNFRIEILKAHLV